MFLRFATACAVLAIGFAYSLDRADAQGYPYVYRNVPPGPPPYEIVPNIDDEEEPVVLVPDTRPGFPYPARPERYAPPPPGFVYPERAEPAPYGHMPGRDPAIRRGELPPLPPADISAPRPPAGVNPNQQPIYSTLPPAGVNPNQQSIYSTLPPEDQPEVGERKELPPHLRRQLVDYRTKEPAGTLIIDTANTYLYLVLGNGQAMRYGIGVGREGFTWAGSERISRMAEWPDWHPPEEMIERQPYLPRFMAGGEGNPLGARALYLGKTLYRIHGTNQPSTIGTFVSSGCVRLTNEDIQDLYDRVKVGNRVVVLPGKPPATAHAQPPAPAQGLPPAPAQGLPPASVQGLPPATAQAQQPPPIIRAR
jgi:lipoprotein-anchoring transpeptidase ErfK/SrfK